MVLAKRVFGVILILIGLVWIGQGLNLVGGSAMSGRPIFAVLGLVVVVVGAWLLRSAQGAAQGVARP